MRGAPEADVKGEEYKSFLWYAQTTNTVLKKNENTARIQKLVIILLFL